MSNPADSQKKIGKNHLLMSRFETDAFVIVPEVSALSGTRKISLHFDETICSDDAVCDITQITLKHAGIKSNSITQASPPACQSPGTFAEREKTVAFRLAVVVVP